MGVELNKISNIHKHRYSSEFREFLIGGTIMATIMRLSACKRLKISSIIASILVIMPLSAATAQSEMKVLFIGNSVIYTNDLPVLFEAICKARNKAVVIDQYTRADFSISRHMKQAETVEIIGKVNWDNVIFNEHN